MIFSQLVLKHLRHFGFLHYPVLEEGIQLVLAENYALLTNSTFGELVCWDVQQDGVHGGYDIAFTWLFRDELVVSDEIVLVECLGHEECLGDVLDFPDAE
jgi:hypothetical protein